MYERPTVKSTPAASIVECLGPVQGYDGSGGDRGRMDTLTSGDPDDALRSLTRL